MDKYNVLLPSLLNYISYLILIDNCSSFLSSRLVNFYIYEALALIVIIIEYLYRHPGYCEIYNNK